ncbi:MAG TPA: ATP-binding protein [Anaerolineaceae bacterium]
MRRSLSFKLILAFLSVAILSALLMAVFIRLTSVDRLSQFLVDQQRSDMVESLAAYYASTGSWQSVDQDWKEIVTGTVSESMPTPPAEAEKPPDAGYYPPGNRGRGFFGLADQNGQVLISVTPQMQPGAQLSAAELANGTPITVDGVQVGTLLTVARVGSFNPEEALFLRRTNQAILFAGLAALVVAVLLGLLLATRLTRPLNALTRAAHEIAGGQLEQQVTVTSRDEIGELAKAFNTMSQEVARGNQMRRQMTADIAHDLRTPLTVIAGYIESMRDGVLQPTPQRLALIYAEIEQLQNLVGDLRMLTLAETGELALNIQDVEPAGLLEQVAQIYQHRAGQQDVQLGVDVEPGVPALRLDETRMFQVFDNLISNALRYTPTGGTIVLQARKSGAGVDLSVRDTGSGIAEEELPYIFNRFHRADKSRHAEEGESGLGLAIVKALVEVQRGQVWAESTPGQGSVIHMEFPLRQS